MSVAIAKSDTLIELQGVMTGSPLLVPAMIKAESISLGLSIALHRASNTTQRNTKIAWLPSFAYRCDKYDALNARIE
jgi:hypothetical protein